MKINLNKWAKVITEREGKVKSLSIAQVKEVLSIVLHDLKEVRLEDVADTLKNLPKKKKR